MKILHVLYQSLPQISGSSIRTRDILMSQKDVGMDIIAITAPFQKASKKQDIINEIIYHRTALNDNDSITDKPKNLLKRILRFCEIIPFSIKLRKLIKKERPDVIHAHAMFFCGLPALFLGKLFKTPVVYEIRSLWMLDKSAVKKSRLKKTIEKLLFGIELFIIKRVDLVVVINDNLKTEFLRAGVNENSIVLVMNAFNHKLINKSDEEPSLLLKTQNNINFGYIGTLIPHEGVDLLIDVFSQFNIKHPHSRLVIFGSGLEQNNISKLARLTKNVFYKGSLAPNEIEKAFSEIDVIINPRISNKLTETVTPLKPLEAMGYKKFFIGSDVGGIKELVTHKLTGLLFKKDDKNSFLRCLENLVQMDFLERKKIIEAGYNYVLQEKSWLSNAYLYKNEYQKIIENKNISQ